MPAPPVQVVQRVCAIRFDLPAFVDGQFVQPVPSPVPGVSQAPGFVAGYWTRKDDSGVGMVIFESEDAA